MKEYDEEEVKAKLAEGMAIIESMDVKLQFSNIRLPPDMICLNCGRCVLVGKCCDDPNQVVMEKKLVSPEVWDQIQELIKNPPAPTQALIDLMTRKPRYEIRTK